MPLILEGIVTTLNADGELNIAPMGPLVDDALTTFEFRPFQTSRTYRNLKQSRVGVFHVVDDVYLLAQAAIDRWQETPETRPATRIEGRVISSACRWYEFEITECDDRSPRCQMTARVLHHDRLRDYWGLNRAKHAVLEGAILATRLHLLSPQMLRDEFARLETIVQKTAGTRELLAFELLKEYVSESATSAATDEKHHQETR